MDQLKTAERGGFLSRYGPWALVAGGSQGLGAAFADELAARGLNLLLIARRPGPLEETAESLRSRHGVQVRTAAVDLSLPGFLPLVQAAAEGLEIGLLVCDAANAHTGLFLDAGLEACLQILDTNCRAPLSLIHGFGGLMAGRGRGGIVVMSSLSAFWGSPYVAVYGATKAFLLNLSEALGHELGARGVDVTVCTAGPVLTPNYVASKPAGVGPSALEMMPQKVASLALRALGRKHLVVPGALNRLAQLFMGRLVPRRAAVSLLARSTSRMYGRK
jgi:short-subunit dehydrogenase